ncbi:MAG: transcriptional repressor LexA [Clostridiales bacterium]|nr:transcriptional repressor LexA [Clostridiales bacterium]
MTVYEKIRYLREQQGMSQQELADKIGYKSRSTINKIELGQRDLTQSKVAAFAKALGVSFAYLIGITDSENQKIKNLMPIEKIRKIPLLGTIACGEPILAQENWEDVILLPSNINADFALTCKGDSMIGADICDGDIVYIKQQPMVDNGEIAAVLIDDEATLKKVYKYKDKVVLQPANSDYEPLIFIQDEINSLKILGKAVGLLRKI